MVTHSQLYKDLYALVKDNMTISATVTAPYENTKGEMPEVVVKAPPMPKESLSFGRYLSDSSFEVDIYAEGMGEILSLVDDVENAVLNNYSTTPIRRVTVTPSDMGSFQMNNKQVRFQTLVFNFKLTNE